ncbi:hypothetical protein [Archangium lansingense]|uniref:Outer membrane protein beta-barrel domain-containing protein n=1 Tax=Archangium lansingense TaxID=2995310 RepID=A0ABT4A896_9BACT|nr:hypothetical protein [Archangium lansinium]MCY1077883.1 hypothetical protein [Archangium lansinium]
MRHWMMLVAALLPGMAAASGHELSLGGALFSTSGLSLALPYRPGFEAAYAYQFDTWRLGGGVRWNLGGGSPPLEVYARAQLTADMGVWRPAVGPELGLSGLRTVGPAPTGYPNDYQSTRAGLFGPAYVAIHAAPLRFAFGRFTASTLELHWGTLLTPRPGSVLRLQLGLLQVGVML